MIHYPDATAALAAIAVKDERISQLEAENAKLRECLAAESEARVTWERVAKERGAVGWNSHD